MSDLSFVAYLAQRLRTSGLNTQSALARESGIHVTYINRIFKGRILRPEIETLEKIALAIKRPIEEVMRAAGYPAPKPTHHELTIDAAVGTVTATRDLRYSVDTAELAEIGRGVLQLINERRNIMPGPRIRVVDMQRVPVVNGLSATQLADGVRQVEQWIDVASTQLNGAQDPVAYIIAGDCLWERWGIKTGDTLIVDAANTDPRDGQVVAARINDDEETAKEFHRVPGGIDLRPTSAGYKSIEIRGTDQLVIIGVYVTHLVTGKR